MATLFAAGFWVPDPDGNPLSGAKVRVYTANTVVAASLFADAALTVPIPNPCITNAEGFPTSDGSNECVIYCASGTYDVAVLTSADVLLRSWDDLSPVGAETDDIERTLDGGARFKVTGAAGEVMIQVGDPSPDNVGGTLTLEGWNGTQGDDLTLDFADVNVTGELTVSGKKVSAYVHTEATTFSGVTSAAPLTIALPNTPAGTRRYRVTIFDVLVATNASEFRVRLSYGGSIKSGASDYAWAVNHDDVASPGTVERSGDAAADYIYTGGTMSIQTTKPGRFVFDIITPDSGNMATDIAIQAAFFDSGAIPLTASGQGHGLGSFGRADGLVIYPGTVGTTLSGAYVVECLRGFGD